MSVSQVEAQSVTWQSDRNVLKNLKPFLMHILQFICGLILPLLVLCIWEIAARRQWLPEQILPAPQLVWSTLLELWQSGDLQSNFIISSKRIIYSVLLGSTIGLTLGIWFALSKSAQQYILPSIQLLTRFPIIGWIPLLMIFLGIDEALKIVAISLAVISPVLIATFKGIQHVPQHLLEVASVYQFSKWQTFNKVILPASLPAVISGLRQGIMQAWLALVFVELLASSEGIGYLMVWGRQLMQMDIIYMGIILIGLTGFFLDSILAAIERFTRFYSTRTRGV
ncbi:ABC transporter permease [Acinetobacter gerneri]|uniref:ABC transporter permease n=1 Tax=Acinetobacter gerneri TaxID=202952 RepID=A0AAW8JPA9_9GAMM|nr:ABC transporter permease [Acinetobacter gerneri]MDQ9011597.1 ABC transporter permease [Acinetobacter gerneri]MDQ9015731.1 ABC transporter permease [Acinetobacter gerneri]MDQ9026902.1 ABC transporter permease [Acinetobacter gerneri]MDQ9054185.1 ABC transporter permease [Acinetobacter gerneri]MDQ9061878.1 ABC transporter permease [Acinetobacter gerneri]